MRASADDPGFQMEEASVDLLELSVHLRGEPVDLLIEPDDALADELELAHELLGHAVEVTPGLGRARRQLRPEFMTEPLAELTESAIEILDERLVHATTLSAAVIAVKCIVWAPANRDSSFAAHLLTEVLTEVRTELTESSIQIVDM